MIPFHHRLAAVALAALLLPAAARAQGSLGVQGFGYPPGQLSTRSISAGGATGEIDVLSPLNPAALLGLGGSTLYVQAEPEYRSVRIADVKVSTTTARYPVFFGGFALGPRWAVGLSSSTFTDRTWATTTESLELIAGDTVRTRKLFSSEGAINDNRLAAAYLPVRWLRLGIGLHALSGRNRIVSGDSFPNNPSFVSFLDTNVISFGGNAISAGAEVRFSGIASFAIDARKGGRLSAETSPGDTVLGRADVPDRLGLSAAYLGIANSVIAVRAVRDSWSSFRGLGTPGLVPRDVWDYGVGADIAGPRFGSRVIMVRAGGRWRDLPFDATSPTGVTASVREKSISGGLGTLFAGGRGALDVGLLRASRSSALDVSEHSWILSVGITVRP